MTIRHVIKDTAASMPFDGASCTPPIDADNVEDGICKAFNSGLGALTPFQFEAQGNSSDKWMSYNNNAKSSDVVPFILPQDTDIRGITFSNANDDVDIDVEIYKNGTLVHTELIRNKRWYYNISATALTTGSQGDRISLFLLKYTGGSGITNAQDPVVTIYCKFLDADTGTGGAQNGVT